jgi:hypothetical protein
MRSTPPKQGRRPSRPTRKIEISRSQRSSLTRSSGTSVPERVGYSMVATPGLLHARLRRVLAPRPGVPEPGSGQHMQCLCVWAGIGHPHSHQYIERIRFGIAHVDDPVAVVVEGAGVQQLVLRVQLAAPSVLVNKRLIRERRLRIVVPPAIPGVTRQGIQVPPVLLGVLAMIALRACAGGASWSRP